MTSLPAEFLGIKNRGVIGEGMYADLVVFNPERVVDRATFFDPHTYPEGIEYVITNGKIVISGGEHTGEMPGKVLKRGQ